MKNKLYLKGQKGFRFAIPIKKSPSWTPSIWLYILERAKVHSVVLSINLNVSDLQGISFRYMVNQGQLKLPVFLTVKFPSHRLDHWVPRGFQTDLFPFTVFLITVHPFGLQSCLFSWSLQILASTFSSVLPDISSFSFISQIIPFWGWWGISSVIYAHLAWLPLQSIWSHNTAILITTPMHQHFQSNTTECLKNSS